MGRESIEEGELSSPLVPEEKHEVYAGVSGSGGGGEQSGSSATPAVVLTTLVAVSGSYVFGSAVSALTYFQMVSFANSPILCTEMNKKITYTCCAHQHIPRGPRTCDQAGAGAQSKIHAFSRKCRVIIDRC
jgi:hypothetical protein